MLTKILMLVVFFAITILIGIFCRKHAKSVDGFVLGGRSVGAWFTAFAFGTSYFSAVIFVGYAGQFGWRFGLASTWIGLANAFIGSLLAWVVLGRRTRIMTQHLNSRTMPDFFGLRYGSDALKIAASVIVFIFLIPYTASLFNGLSRLFTMAFPNIDYAWCVVVMAVLTGIYVIVGGYMATAVNDFIQGIIMIVGIVTVIAAVLNGQGGLSEAIAKLSATSSTTAAGTQFHGAYTSFFGADPAFLFFVVILTADCQASATHCAKSSLGVFQSRHFLGRLLIRSSTNWTSSSVTVLKSNPFGKKNLTISLVLSFVPRCHGL